MKNKIRILIVDDHAMVRFGLGRAIARERDLQVVAEASNGEAALGLFAEHNPDVVVMDYKLPGMDGAQSTAALRGHHPEARVILLSIYEGSEDVWRATQAGAVGYVSKSVEIDEVLRAIRQVAAGEVYFSAGLAEKLASRKAEQSLTDRELEVLRQVVLGRSNKEISSVLHVAQATVKRHMENIFAKLHVLDRTQATAAAVHRGILHIDQ